MAGFSYGGDYAPEQWSEDVWADDLRLMKTAGVNLVTVGVFGWARLQPGPGRFEFGWLDRIMDLLAGHGIGADLATATASPPPWFSAAHPESLPVDADGIRSWYGSRQAYCPSSPVYRAAAVELVERLAGRYAGHPALQLWHVNNEYGCHVSRCWCDASAVAFRDWLRSRYSTVDELNEAWGTAFWSQWYTDWDEILPPRRTPSFANPAQQLDFYRFSSDELLACFRAEREVLERLSPGVPVTTNLLSGLWDVDYWRLAAELDVVAVDHYLIGDHPAPEANLAFAADLARSLAGGRPWLLMEHSTSAVNWQPRNLAKVPGQLRRNSLTHVARGADAVLFFQWRASKAGAEKWHSGMLPHAGTDTKVWREVMALGAELGDLADVAGSSVTAHAAIVLDWPSLWAQDHPYQPSVDLRPTELIEGWHRALYRAGVTADFVRPQGTLDRYRLVLVPALYLISDEAAEHLAGYVANGGTVLIGPYSGIVDERDQVRLGGYPGAFRDLLGVRVEEFFPLPAGGRVRLDDGGEGLLWTELGESTGAEVLVRYADGPLAGSPALTRHRYGRGVAYYLGTHRPEAELVGLLADRCDETGVPRARVPDGVELVRRSHVDGRGFTFVINHNDYPVTVEGTEVPPGGVIVRRSGIGESAGDPGTDVER